MTWIFVGWMVSRLLSFGTDPMLASPSTGGWTFDGGTGQPPAQLDGGTGQPPAQLDGGTGQPPAKLDGGTGQPPARL